MSKSNAAIFLYSTYYFVFPHSRTACFITCQNLCSVKFHGYNVKILGHSLIDMQISNYSLGYIQVKCLSLVIMQVSNPSKGVPNLPLGMHFMFNCKSFVLLWKSPNTASLVCLCCLSCSGLIYLNDDFEGGDFFWAHRNQSIQVGTSPLVSFYQASAHCTFVYELKRSSQKVLRIIKILRFVFNQFSVQMCASIIGLGEGYDEKILIQDSTKLLGDLYLLNA